MATRHAPPLGDGWANEASAPRNVRISADAAVRVEQGSQGRGFRGHGPGGVGVLAEVLAREEVCVGKGVI